jgi:uncharacterized membrane-anchored protein YitT (DUF2179 family)
VRPADSEASASRHSALEDALAIVTAAGFASLGFSMLRQAGLVGGGVAGLALLLARVTPLSFGTLLAALNAPFVALALSALGWRFAVRSAVAVALVALFADGLGLVLSIGRLDPLYAALMGGSLVGIALLMLFRHQASLGGIGILAQWLQVRRRIPAGLFQMAADGLIVAASLFLAVPPLTVALSVVGAVALNLVLAVNHRPGRYLGT